jgi:hypothetical protein
MISLWKMPFPSSWGVETRLVQEPHRRLRLEIFDQTGEHSDSVLLLFSDVQTYRCTFLPALTAEQISISYDCLVELPAIRLNIQTSTHKCFVICFDDGPCYEIVAASVQF